jgi:hypothetical protein
MPTYCYSDDVGKVHERVFRMGQAPKLIRLNDGRVAVRDFQAEHVSMPSSAGWPLECIASGVNAAQAGELREFFRVNGCPTEVTNDGNPVYTSASHRRKALKLRGMHDRNSF